MVFFFAIPRMTTSNRYDPVGNVTQVTSSYPWLQNQNFSETFTYDASDQFISASETNSSSYQLAVTYGNWGKISGYSLAQTDLQHNVTTQVSRSMTYPCNINNIGNSQTMFAPTMENGYEGVDYTFGINGSLRKREVQHPMPYTEYYLFNSAANLKAYSNNLTDFAYYGYNASNTRAYKLSMLNQNQWVNGQPFPLHFLCWLKENEAKERAFCGGEKNPVHHARQLAERRNPLRSHRSAPLSCYGKRIFSVTPQVGEMTYSNREIQRIQLWQDATVSSEVPPCNLLFSFLCFVSFIFSGRRKKERNEGKNFYYHTNHLGSTAFVTDQNQNITQGFLYAPFGEITTEYNSNFGNDIIPKYAFNAKELDEETGMYYYEARYYKPPVFTSRDPMFEKYFWMTPYAYCANNPVKYVDPTGEFPIHKHKKLVSRAIKDANISISKKNLKLIKKGASRYADIKLASESSIHLDNMGDYNSVESGYNNAVEKLKSTNYLEKGVGLHTIADFYSHSNYIDIYMKYVTEVKKEELDINKIPTFEEAMKIPELNDLLKKELKTGTYGGYKSKIRNYLSDRFTNDPNAHGNMNLDKNRGKGNDLFCFSGKKIILVR